MLKKRSVAYWSIKNSSAALIVYDDNTWSVYDGGQPIPCMKPGEAPNDEPVWIRPGWRWDKIKNTILPYNENSIWNDDTMPIRLPYMEAPRDVEHCKCPSFDLANKGHDSSCPEGSGGMS